MNGFLAMLDVRGLFSWLIFDVFSATFHILWYPFVSLPHCLRKLPFKATFFQLIRVSRLYQHVWQEICLFTIAWSYLMRHLFELFRHHCILHIFSSPEHKVPLVSYCDWPLSFVSLNASCFVWFASFAMRQHCHLNRVSSDTAHLILTKLNRDDTVWSPTKVIYSWLVG